MNEISINHSKIEDIHSHFLRVDKEFVPSLSSYSEINVYAKKLFEKSTRFEIWSKGFLVGLLAVYENSTKGEIFISNFSVEKTIQGQGIAQELYDKCFREIYKKNPCFKEVYLEVNTLNKKAMKFYFRNGFTISKTLSENKIQLKKSLYD